MCSWGPTRYSPSSDQVGLGEAGLEVALGDLVAGEGLLRREEVEDRRERLRAQVDGGAGRAGRGRVGRRHQRDGLRVVADLVGDEGRLVVVHEVDDVLAGDVGGRDDDDARPVEGGVAVDAEEAGARLGRAHGQAEPGALDNEVVGVARGAGHLGRGVAAGHGGADQAAHGATMHARAMLRQGTVRPPRGAEWAGRAGESVGAGRRPAGGVPSSRRPAGVRSAGVRAATTCRCLVRHRVRGGRHANVGSRAAPGRGPPPGRRGRLRAARRRRSSTPAAGPVSTPSSSPDAATPSSGWTSLRRPSRGRRRRPRREGWPQNSSSTTRWTSPPSGAASTARSTSGSSTRSATTTGRATPPAWRLRSGPAGTPSSSAGATATHSASARAGSPAASCGPPSGWRTGWRVEAIVEETLETRLPAGGVAAWLARLSRTA